MKIKIDGKNILSVLFAFTICMNIIRFFGANIGGNYIAYAIYGILFFLSIISGKLFKGSRRDIIVDITVFALCLYALCYSFASGSSETIDALKFLMIVCIALYSYRINSDCIQSILNISIGLNIVYALILILRPSLIDSFQHAGGTYLTMTLPLGMALSMSLVKFITLIYTYRWNKKNGVENSSSQMIITLFISMILFYSLSLFPARSSLLFPVIVAIPFIIIEAGLDKRKIIIIILIFIITIIFGYRFFMEHANSYVIYRMNQLFTSSREEDRWLIWKRCLDLIIKEKWFLFGGGTNAFEFRTGYYPHNIYLHTIGEYGIIGLIACIMVTVRLLSDSLKSIIIVVKNKTKSLNKKYESIFFMEFAACFYLWMSYMKSFSLYDSAPLLIMVGLTLNMCKMRDGIWSSY